MTADTHRIGGLAVGTSLCFAFHESISQIASVLTFSYLGSVFCDIDTRCSAISYKMPVTSCFISVMQKLVRLLTIFFPKKIQQKIRRFIGHRGFFHSLAGAGGCGFLVYYLLSMTFLNSLAVAGGLSMTAGMLSHILLDLLSGNVPLLLPFCTKEFSLAHLKTGGHGEHLLRYGFIALFSVTMVFFIKIRWLKIFRFVIGCVLTAEQNITATLTQL